MRPRQSRTLRVAVTQVAYDLVLTVTSDMGTAKLTGVGQIVDPESGEAKEEIGKVDLTFWGSTTEPLRMRAKTWPRHFDYVTGDYFGVSSAGEHRFDIFLANDRFMRLLDLAHGSRHAILTLRCDVSADGKADLVRELEISATRG